MMTTGHWTRSLALGCGGRDRQAPGDVQPCPLTSVPRRVRRSAVAAGRRLHLPTGDGHVDSRMQPHRRRAGQLISLRRSSRTVSRHTPSSWAMRVRTARVR